MAVLTLNEAHQYLQKNIPFETIGRDTVLTLTKWASERNIAIGNPLITYIREGINIGYTIKEYTSKNQKKNFLVIKMPDTSFHGIKDFHLDFFLGKELTNYQMQLVEKHPDLKSRWLIYGSKLVSATVDDLKAIFSSAVHKRFKIKL